MVTITLPVPIATFIVLVQVWSPWLFGGNVCDRPPAMWAGHMTQHNNQPSGAGHDTAQ